MRVAIDTESLTSGHSVRGIGVMVNEQINALLKESKSFKDIKIFPVDFQTVNLSEYDILHYPYFFPYSLTLPKEKIAKKIVVTIQDLIHLIYPKNYPPGLRGRVNLFKQRRRLKLVDAVMTVSETSKKDIVRYFSFPPEKIYVVYEAAKKIYTTISDTHRLRDIAKKYKLPNKFVLYVGDMNFNKNIPALLKACRLINIPVVICGKQAPQIDTGNLDLKTIKGPRDWVRYILNIPHPELIHYKELLKEFNKNKNIFRLGFVPDEDLLAIYNLATVYVQPSFYEGFGIPVLEAFACGCPVIVSRTNALVEISGGAALTFDPLNIDELSENISKIIENSNLRSKLILDGRKRVKFFSWSNVARDIIKVYKEIGNS